MTAPEPSLNYRDIVLDLPMGGPSASPPYWPSIHKALDPAEDVGSIEPARV